MAWVILRWQDKGRNKGMLEENPVDDPWYLIASRIRIEREKLGLSTTQLARGLGVSRTTIHNWEGGKPIPIERCASIASFLGIDHEELLTLHPHSTSLHLDNNNHDPGNPSRLIKVGLAVTALIVIGTMLFTWSTAQASCVEPGAGGGSLLGPFRDAYDRYGGEPVLGCAINEVHKWGPGFVQDFEGGSSERSTLMTLNRTDVYYLGGDMWWDYVDIADGATPDVVGVAASEILQCGPATVLRLEGGHTGPGALVSNVSGDHHVWLDGDIWTAYKRAGGPMGRLGQPIGAVEQDQTSTRAEFEGGTITHAHGEAAMVDPPLDGQASFATHMCNPVKGL